MMKKLALPTIKGFPHWLEFLKAECEAQDLLTLQ